MQRNTGNIVKRGRKARCGCRHGSSIPEYALLLALIAGGLLLTYQFWTASTTACLNKLVNGINAPSTLPTASNRPEFSLAEEVSGEPAAPAVGLVLDAKSVFLMMGLGLGGILWLIVMSRRLRKDAKKEAVAAAADLLDSKIPAAIFSKRQGIRQVFEKNLGNILVGEMQVKHVMSTRLTAVTPDTIVRDAKDVMEKRHMRHLLVCDRKQRLVGILSDRDLHRIGRTVTDVMTPNPVCLAAEDEILPAITLMINRHISCLPVLEKGQLVGVLTSTDLMLTLQCTLQLLRQVADELRPSSGPLKANDGQPGRDRADATLPEPELVG